MPFLDQNDWNASQAEDRFTEDVQRLASDLRSAEGGVAAPGTADALPAEPVAVASVRRYHAAMEDAFRATGASLDPALVARASREAVLEELLLPFNRMLGQRRASSVVTELSARARVAFVRDLVLRTGAEQGDVARLEPVFGRLLEIVAGEAASVRREWGDDRYAFLPLQLALLPEDHDTQAEIDELVERAVGRPFADGNEAWYVVSEQFQYELRNMINATRDYHVLWIHDYRGYDDGGEPDADSYRITVDGYLNAIAERLERFDEEGLLPIYIIIIDQWFYEANAARLWLDLLEAPLDHEMRLPPGYEAWETEIAAAQDRIRRAIADSPLLQAEIREYGEDWLRNRVKVQINVTDPADPTFWSDDVFPLIGLPDALLRDHRKIAFYDVVPGDPSRGMALYTGMGVGEHYTGPTWDDRALRLRGPALEGLRVEARNLLLQQGFREDQLPFPLRDPDPTTLEARRLAARSTEAAGPYRALQVHNWIGYGRKDATVLKATLYCLMPPGAVVKAPDSLWNLPLWGSLLLGHALRGGRVVIVAPTLDSAPARAPTSMALTRQLLGRLLVSRDVLAESLRGAGGSLHIGLYEPEHGVADIPGKARQLVATMRREPWLADLHGLAGGDLDGIEAVADSLTAAGFEARYLEGDALDFPKLHMKAHYFATREAWDPLVRNDAFPAFLREYLRQRALQIAQPDNALALTQLTDNLEPAASSMFAQYRAAAGADADRAALYFLVGSQNQNYRSMAGDGEVLVAIAGEGAVVGMADFVLVLGQSRWLRDAEELHALLPEPGGMLRRASHWLRISM